MANYVFAVATKEKFKVKNPNEVEKVFCTAGYEETYQYEDGSIFIGSYDFSLDNTNVIFEKDSESVLAVERGWGDYYSIETGEELELDLDNYKVMDIWEYLSEQLLDGEVAGLVEAGNEKLRFVGAYVLVITKKGVKGQTTNQIIDEIAEEMLKC